MEPAGQHQGICRDTEPSPNLTINHLPDEILLEIFDFYRQSIDPDDHQWREKYVWLNLAHVCGRWRAVISASSSRLDLGITVGPQKPGHIKTILSSPWPIFVKYECTYARITGSALWRMRAALGHRDRVRGITFEGTNSDFQYFFRETKCSFPVLESLSLCFGEYYEQNIPVTFLGGPELSDLRLRRLSLDCLSLAPMSGFLLSATALTDLVLVVEDAIESSTDAFLLECLRGMHCLRNLNLSIISKPLDHPSQNSVPKDTVQMPNLTHFLFIGQNTFLNNLMAGFSAPSLQNVCFWIFDSLPILHIPRFIDGLSEQYCTVNLTFDGHREGDFCLSLLTHSRDIDHLKPSFLFHTNRFPESIESITSSSMSSTKLAAAENLALIFSLNTATVSELLHHFPLRQFLRQFRSVKMLRLDPFVPEVALSLQQDDGAAFLPLLEEIELSVPSISRSAEGPDEEYQHRAAAELAAFEPFVSAREKTGRPVNVFHGEMLRPIEEKCECASSYSRGWNAVIH